MHYLCSRHWTHEPFFLFLPLLRLHNIYIKKFLFPAISVSSYFPPLFFYFARGLNLYSPLVLALIPRANTKPIPPQLMHNRLRTRAWLFFVKDGCIDGMGGGPTSHAQPSKDLGMAQVFFCLKNEQERLQRQRGVATTDAQPSKYLGMAKHFKDTNICIRVTLQKNKKLSKNQKIYRLKK